MLVLHSTAGSRCSAGRHMLGTCLAKRRLRRTQTHKQRKANQLSRSTKNTETHPNRRKWIALFGMACWHGVVQVSSGCGNTRASYICAGPRTPMMASMSSFQSPSRKLANHPRPKGGVHSEVAYGQCFLIVPRRHAFRKPPTNCPLRAPIQ